MINALKKFKYLIIIAVVIILGFVAYTIYTKPSAEGDSSSLQRTTGGFSSNTVAGSGSDIISNELAKSFVEQLSKIESIKLKIAFFDDKVYLGLKDNYKEIPQQPKIRPNPFAPIGSEDGQVSTEYQDISGRVIKSTTGIPTSEGSVPTTASSSATSSKTTSTKTGTTTTRTGSSRAQ